MPQIHQLPQSLINKIAAGEVIERPASVVKELMENAVDAGARRVDVTVQSGGVDLIRVVDDGCGIPADELPLAVASHATSKLSQAEDLFRIATLGFRGEALASIAEVSRVLLRSRTPESDSGAEIEITGGRSAEVVPCGLPVGTSAEVHNLFYNTPVRRKFLRTTQTEFGHVSEAFTRIALGTPTVHFTLRHNDRQVFDLAASDEWVERIARFFGRELAANLIRVESTDDLSGGQVRLAGYVAAPTHNRANNRMQYVFLNGRHIRDRALQHALGEAYRGLLMVKRYPIAFLTLEMPPEMVDVNVHPTKLEVRFQDSGRLYSQLLSALRTKFLATDLSPQVRSPAEEDPTGDHDEARAEELRQELVDWAKGEMQSWQTPADPRSQAAAQAAFNVGASGYRQPLQLQPLARPRQTAGELPSEQSDDPMPEESIEDRWGSADHGNPPDADVPVGDVPRALAMQIHNRYLVTESDRGITIIDQHALHERILYEHLRQRMDAGMIETQNLLIPEPVDLGADEIAAVLENRELLAELGMRIEPFGGDTLLIVGFPTMLANLSPVEILHELIARLLAGGKKPDRRDLLDELLHAIACKAAVKAGDRLAPDEIKALLEQRYLVDDPHHCPHGRPTELVFTHEELEKQFKRT